jgi:hypothetical protein
MLLLEDTDVNMELLIDFRYFFGKTAKSHESNTSFRFIRHYTAYEEYYKTLSAESVILKIFFNYLPWQRNSYR